jgi:DNA uptake protein ComE-like DNA-binding protein
MAKVRINLDNPVTLQTLPGLDHSAVEAILRFRAEHGPIQNPAQLASILGGRPLNPGLLERLDFSPADPTSPEAPGA